MIYRKIAAVCLCLAALPVLAASPLPQKMAGKQQTNGGGSGIVEATLVQTQGAEAAKLKLSFVGDCTRSGETTAEFRNGVWQFVIPGSAKCEEVSVQVRQVEGKNRMEGEFKTGKKDGTIYYEWN